MKMLTEVSGLVLIACFSLTVPFFSSHARAQDGVVWARDAALSERAAEASVQRVWTARAASIADARRASPGDVVESAGHTMRLKERTFGDAPEGERSLWISLHGGGGTTAQVNDGQWENQIRLYEPAEGIYVAPRAPTDTWNLWHQSHIDDLLDTLISSYVATRGVDPDRVYLMGYSAGGDGVYQLGPRMADRFAAAAMMAGHPNDARPEGLRNLPFAIFMGGKDEAYSRNTVAASWGERLGSLRSADPAGYEHLVRIYPEHGHWMNGEDRECLPWMASKARNPWPERVVWVQDDVTQDRFYWLGVKSPKRGTMISATADGQTIRIESDDIRELTLFLRDELIDLDRPVRVLANGREVFSGTVRRTEGAIVRSLQDRADPRMAATAILTVRWETND